MGIANTMYGIPAFRSRKCWENNKTERTGLTSDKITGFLFWIIRVTMGFLRNLLFRKEAKISPRRKADDKQRYKSRCKQRSANLHEVHYNR